MRKTTWRKSSFSDQAGSSCVEVAFWRKSSYSDQAGSDCVEVAFVPTGVAVRDSKNSSGSTLTFGAGAWRRFVLK
jgi:uncharacterized protein DUF397